LKRALLKGPRDLVVEEVTDPAAGPGEVLVRVSACDICRSDVHTYTGIHPFVIYPVVPGHEFSGTIESVGAGVETELVGARVSVEPSFYCGVCRQCLSGRDNICANLRVIGFQAPGAMCELLTVPANRIHLLVRRAIEPADFITHRIPLENIEDAYRLLLDPDRNTFKVLIEPGARVAE